MKTQVTKLVDDVMTTLREIDPNEASFVGDKDNADLQTLIESKIEATVDEVHQRASMKELSLDSAVELIYNGEESQKGFVYKASTGILTVLLHSHTKGYEDQTHNVDMLRMVCAKSKSWPFHVHNVVFPDDPLYEIVTDKYVGAQADFPAVTQQKRRLVLDGHHIISTVLELRCLSDKSDWAHITIIPRAKVEEGMVDIDSNLYAKVVDAIATKIITN